MYSRFRILNQQSTNLQSIVLAIIISAVLEARCTGITTSTLRGGMVPICFQSEGVWDQTSLASFSYPGDYEALESLYCVSVVVRI